MAENIRIPTKGDLIAGKYRVDTELGRGAYGIVFLCDHVELGRKVAVKTLLPQAFLQGDVVKRFHREAQLISRLDHPNIIRLFDYGVDEGLLYMTVEFLRGQSLGEVIDGTAPIAPDRVREIGITILHALEHAHAAGIVHRDLKPENIMLLEAESDVPLKVLDFGISKLMQGDDQSAMNTLTQSGTVLGTPHYMSPENIVGDEVDERADLYALGVILYEMLTGEHPFDAPSPSAVFVKHLRDEVPPLDDELQRSALGVAIFRALEKNPEDRVPSAFEFRKIIEANTMELAAFLPPPEVPEKSTKTLVYIAAGMLMLIAILGVAVILTMPEEVGPIERVEPTEPTAVTVVDDPPKQVATSTNNAATAGMVIGADEVGTANQTGTANQVASNTNNLSSSNGNTNGADEKPKVAAVAKKVRKKDRTKLKVEKKKEKDKPKKDESAVVVVRISSEPTKANVRVNGVPVGSTPVRYKTDKPISVRFSHIGYKDKTLSVDPGKSKSVHVTLKKSRIGFID